MNLKKYLSYITFCYLEFVNCINTNRLNMIMSFIIYEERPTSLLIPNLCWSPYERKVLAKTLGEEGISTAYSFQPNRTEFHLNHIIIMADLNCPGMPEFLIQASEKGYFKSPYRWLLLDEHSRAEDLAMLEKLEMPVNSDVIVARKVGEDQILFLEAYKISEHFDIIYTPRSVWRPPNPNIQRVLNNFSTIDDEDKKTATKVAENNISNEIIEEDNTADIYERELKVKTITINKYGSMEDYRDTKVLSVTRRNLRKHTLTMVNVITDSNDTRNHMDDRLHLHQDSITKMSYMVVKLCFEMLNSSEKLIFTHTWGYKDKNGNWQGIVDHLIKNKADLGTLTIFTQERMQIIDYIAMVGTTAVRFVFREPPLSYLFNIFAMPFTGAVWLAILICVLGCSVFLYITSKWEASMGMHHLQLDGSWADVLILIIGAVLQQGCTLEPRHAAGRCAFLLLFVALTILYAAYSANIVVLLRAPSSSIRTLPDLLHSPIKLGASDFEYNRYFFKKLNEPIRKAIYDKKIAPKGKKPNFYSMKDGIEKIRRGLFAFHMELNPGYRLIQETYQEDEKCDLKEIDYINEIDPWIPGQKRSPFKDLFRVNFLKIRESGLQACIHHRLHVPRPRCSGTVSTFSSVGITDMYPAMLATLYGMLLAPFILLLEITYKRLLTMRNKRKILEEPEFASSQNLLRSPYRWLVMSSRDKKNISVIWESPLLVDSDFVLAMKTEEGFIMTELYKPSPNGPTVSTPRGFYNGSFIDTRPHRELFRRRRDVLGHPLTMSNVIQESNTTQYHLPREDRLEPQFDSISKISWSVVKIAFEMLNATPRYIFSHRWGYKQNGQWSGMIADLDTGRADLGTNCLLLSDRLSAVVFTDMVAPLSVRFVFRQPPLSYVSNIFSLPFSSGVWVAIVVSTSVSTAALFLTSRHEVRNGKAPTKLDGTIGDALLLTMSAVSQQGCAMEPRQASGRIVLWVLFTALMALYAAYSANIVVLLQAPSSSIRTLAQLVNSKITLAASEVDYSYFLFRLYNDSVRLEISKKVYPYKGTRQFYDKNDGVERIRQGLFAFHSIVEPLYRQIEKTFLEIEKCDLTEVAFVSDFDPFTPVKKGSPYLELLRNVFKQIRESGIQKAISNRLHVPKPRCSNTGTAFSSVGLLDLKPVLILMLYGIAVSVTIALAEVVVFKLHKRWNERHIIMELNSI